MGLDEIAVFVKVVQAGSFTQAARLLGMPNTTVSAKVATLEKRLGVTLIQRTTRKLHVTQAGELYFRRCVEAIEGIQAAENEVASTKAEPQGLLRITAAVDVGHSLLLPIVRNFVKRYTKVEVDLVITNRVVDLVGEGIDVAFRAGELADSSLIARKFVSADMRFWAAPGYVKKFGAPTHPREIAKHETIRFSEFQNRLELSNGKETQIAEIRGRVSSDDLDTIKLLTMSGDGIGLFPTFICDDEVRKGKLVPILADWSYGSGHFSLVYPAQKFVSPKIQAFIELALEQGKACTKLQTR